MKIIYVNSPKYGIKEILVDDEDYDYLMQWTWHVDKTPCGFYAKRNYKINGKGKRLIMHRVLLNLTNSKIFVDHEDHNGLNNQRSNIRPCTRSQNNKNVVSRGKSEFLGVCASYSNGSDKAKKYFYWKAQIVTKHKVISKVFPFTPEGEIAAAKHYDKLAKKYHKKFANLNFKQ